MNGPALVKSKTGGLAAGLVLDASSSGVCVSLPFRLPIHSGVGILIEGSYVAGEIRNCCCIRAMEFPIGIAVPASDSPQFTDLERLPILQKARARNLFAPSRTSRIWSSPA